MRNIFNVFRREVLSFFVSPIAYFVIMGFTVLGGYFFFTGFAYYNVMLQRARMMPYGAGGELNLNEWVVAGFYQTLIVILVFLVPLLTMRTIAEERKRGTFELLATSPISVGDIVIGKFLAVALVLTLMMVAAFFYPLFLATYGDPEIAPIFSGLLATLLCAFAFASVGMAVSAFSENQIVGGVSSMVVILLLYVIHAPAESMSGVSADVLRYLSPVLQAQDMIKGVVSLKSLVYFASLISFGLFLSQRALEAQRWR